jgi:hypothetical protein
MQHPIDRQRLLDRYGPAPSKPNRTIARCAAGFLILLGVVLIGLHAHDRDVAQQAAAKAQRMQDVSARHPPAAAGAETALKKSPAACGAGDACNEENAPGVSRRKSPPS